MLIHIPFALKKVTFDGISIVCCTEDAMEIQRKRPEVSIKRFRPKRSNKDYKKPSSIRNIPLSEYLVSKGD